VRGYPWIGLPEWEKEFKFHPSRKWRFDYAWPSGKVAVEIEGGAYAKGRHTRGKGFILDMEKYNAGGLLGWKIFRFTPQQFERYEALSFMRRVFSKG
jgi:hypothetical protein